jgi:hypothetical protein
VPIVRVMSAALRSPAIRLHEAANLATKTLPTTAHTAEGR